MLKKLNYKNKLRYIVQAYIQQTTDNDRHLYQL